MLSSRSQLSRKSLANLLKVSCRPLANHSQIVSNSHLNLSLEDRTSTPGDTKIHSPGAPKSSRNRSKGSRSAQEEKVSRKFPISGAQKRPRSGARALQERTKSAQERPRAPQERPRVAPGRFQGRLGEFSGTILRLPSAKRSPLDRDL